MIAEAKRKAHKPKAHVEVNVMQNLSAFALEAPAAVIRELVSRKEIAAAKVNKREGELLIH